MDSIHLHNKIVQDISLLYELSLCIGSSIDLKINCEGFINTLMARKNLEIASVWVKNKYFGNKKEDGFKLIYTSPSTRIKNKEIKESHKIISLLKKNESVIISNDDSEFRNIITEKFIEKGTYAIFRLGNLGFLKIFTSVRKEILTNRELHQLKNVIIKFSISIEGCLSHILAISEFNSIKQLEEREQLLVRFPEENPNPVMRIFNDGILNYANKSSKILLNFWGISIGKLLPIEMLNIISSVNKLKRRREIEVVCGERIFLLMLEPISNLNYINIYGLDITQRKHAKNELNDLKIFYEQTLRDLPGQIAVFDTNLKYLFVNPHIISDENVREWLIGKDDYEFCKYYGLSTIVAEQRQQKLKQVIKERKPIRFEEQIENSSGELLYFIRVITPVINDKNEITKILAYGIDITDRIRAEHAVKISEEKYRLLLEHSGSAIIFSDKKGKIILANSILANNFDKTPDELVGKSIYDVLPKEISRISRKRFSQTILTGEGAQFEDLVELKGGKRWFSSSIQPVKDNQGITIGIQTISNDISERKLNEQELKETNLQNILYSKELSKTILNLKKSERALLNSQKQLSSVLNTVGEGIITFDSLKKIILMNNEAIEMFAYSKDELDGKNVDILFGEKCKEIIGEIVELSLAGNKIDDLSKRIEVEGVRNGGYYFPIAIKITETQIDNKPFFTAAVHDISDLDILIKELERSNSSLSEFAYIASHDLKEPLRKIVSFGNLLERSLENQLDEDNLENLAYMVDGAKRMHNMVEDLLDYSRLTSRKIVLQKINLDELVDGLIHFELAALIEETNAVIEKELNLGTINGEPAQIKQLFQNLISNGIKYRKRNLAPVIKIRAIPFARTTILEVKDNGIGIDSKYQSQIFEMFKRLHSRDKYSGNGIGLAICKKIVDIHNGEIGVRSKLGKHSTFWFNLS